VQYSDKNDYFRLLLTITGNRLQNEQAALTILL